MKEKQRQWLLHTIHPIESKRVYESVLLHLKIICKFYKIKEVIYEHNHNSIQDFPN